MASTYNNSQSGKSGKALRLCFGHSTALEIQRHIDASRFVPARGTNLLIADKAPSKKSILETIGKIEAFCPSLQIKQPAHILVGNPASCWTTDAYTLHSCQIVPSYGSLLQLGSSVLVSSPPFAFTQMVAYIKDPMAIIRLGYEICGTYKTLKTDTESAYEVPPLTSVRALQDFVMRNPSIHGSGKVRQALRYIADGSASPRETQLALVLGLPMTYGGYGLGIPYMNYEVETNGAARSITGKNHLRCDLCWPQAKLDVEYQSREMHSGEDKRISDSRRANALAAMGWKTVSITDNELNSLYAIDTIAQTIRMHLKKKKRPEVSHYYSRKLKLRTRLGLPVGYDWQV